ncbi:hypothetical protein T492DRAFT_1046913 [Pavlovales sp. CCMP2436]|nr:hypothetical protein T492DRAFT_1046913 [Pavlovales sp. CCMP2436]
MWGGRPGTPPRSLPKSRELRTIRADLAHDTLEPRPPRARSVERSRSGGRLEHSRSSAMLGAFRAGSVQSLEPDGSTRWAPMHAGSSLSDGDSEVVSIKRRLEVRYQLVDTSWRISLRWWLEQSMIGKLFEAFHSMLSVVSCGLYIALTYLEDGRDVTSYSVFSILEIIFVCFFMLDYVLRLLAFGSRYAFSIAGIIDLLTTVPTMVPLIADTNAIDLNISFMESPSGGASVGSTSLLFLRLLRLNVRILRALRFLRVLRTLRFVRFSLGSSTTDPQRNLNVQRQVTEIILTALSIVFITASLIQILEVDASGKPRFEWHDSFYLTVVTISTVGYGDRAPITVEARLAICFIIMLSLVLIPRQTSRLISMSSDPGSHGKLPTASMRHLVITGNGCLAHATIAQFLKALYAEEQGSSAVLTSQLPYVVLLHHHPLPRDIRLLMNDRNLLDRVSYVRGSALVENDLLRAKVSSSEAVFVLGDPGSDHYAKEDGISLMTCLAVRSYCRGVPMVIQLLSANSIGELAHTLDPSWPLVHAVNVVEIKNLILAKACSIDCFCTFITNLLLPPSAALLDPDLLAPLAEGEKRELDREDEYAQSAVSRLLLAAAPAALNGAFVLEVSLWLRRALAATLIAIKSGEGGHVQCSLTLNPPVYHRLCEGDILYLVTAVKDAPARVMRLSPEDWRREREGLGPTEATPVWPQVRRLAPRERSAVRAGKFGSPVWRMLQSSGARGGAGGGPHAHALPSPPTLFGQLSWPFGPGDAGPYDAPESARDELLSWRAERAMPPIESCTPAFTETWRQHVILSIDGGTLDWGGVAIFAGALRAASSATKLLVLTYDKPEPQEWALVLSKINGYDPAAACIAWMKGSFAQKRDLLRANVRHAHKLIVFVPPVSQRSANKRGEDDLHLVDQQAVLTYLHLDAAFASRNNPIILELEYFENVRFLRPGPKLRAAKGHSQTLLGYATARIGRRRPAADGVLPTSNSPHIVRHGSEGELPLRPDFYDPPEQRETTEHGAHNAGSNAAFHPVFAAGRVFSMRALDSLLNHAYLEPSIVDLVHDIALPAPEDIFSRLHAHADATLTTAYKSCLAILPVPKRFAGRPFGALFESALATHGVVCLALVTYDVRRQMIEALGRGAPPNRAWELPNVITCPPAARQLRSQDLVYVLTTAQATLLEGD